MVFQNKTALQFFDICHAVFIHFIQDKGMYFKYQQKYITTYFQKEDQS